MVGTSKRYISETVDANGTLQDIAFHDTDRFNFAYDVVDAMAQEEPEKMCMLWVSGDKSRECRFTFKEMMEYSNRTANYFRSLGIGAGDRVMLVLKRHYQFWFAILALHKLGAVVIPATHQLKEEDFTYRFEAGDITALVCTDEDEVGQEVELAMAKKEYGIIKMMTGKAMDGWESFDEGISRQPATWERVDAGGNDPMLMFFTSGTTGYPKIVTHNYKYALAHYITAKYWQCVDPDGIHFTLADTGWGKALWGKLYGQWLCEGAVFVYDMGSFVPHDFLSLFDEYPITTFCAPPTAYRVFVKRDLEQYAIGRLQHVSTAGEALNEEIWQQFYDKTGLKICEGFGQTETTLTLGTLKGTEPRPGSMGKPSPMYEVDLVDEKGHSLPAGQTGEIVIHYDHGVPNGLFADYFGGTGNRSDVCYDGLYHTGDTAYRDEDGYYWYVGRTDDMIKSTGYRVGPFEVESVLMELPFILECAVTGVPDKHRGQKVKATIVLTEGTEPSAAVRAKIISYAKSHMANYKCPRLIEFVEELPKTISGKVRRVELRK